MTNDLKTGRAKIKKQQESWIHKMNESRRSLHYRSSGTVFSPARGVVSSTMRLKPGECLGT